MIKRYCTLIVLVYLLNPAIGQSPILQSYLEEAIENNLSLKTHEYAYRVQQSKFEQAKTMNSFSGDINASYLLARGGRDIEFPVGDLFNPAYATLNQLTGSSEFPTDLENVNTALTPNDFLDAQFQISKPLINSNIRFNKKIQKELLHLASIDKEIEERDLVMQIKTAYYNYHKSIHAETILDESEHLLNDVKNVNSKLIKYDKATPDIQFDVDFQLQSLESQRLIVRQQQETVQALFNLLLNKPFDADIRIDSMLIENELLEPLDLDRLQVLAVNTRPEFDRIDLAKSVNELDIKRTKKDGRFELGIQGGVGVQAEQFDFTRFGPLFTLGLGASLNLFDGGTRKKRVEEIHIQQEILEHNREQLKQKFEIEVTQLYYELQSIEAQLVSEQAAVDFAKRSYQATKKRYENNRAILIEVIQAQNRITSAELSNVLTQYDYLIKRAEINRAISK